MDPPVEEVALRRGALDQKFAAPAWRAFRRRNARAGEDGPKVA
jgi:hypothetical protein